VYLAAPSESVPIPSDSIDLVASAQALHWFRHDSFYDEVIRVSREGAIIAAWAYGLPSVSPGIDQMLRHFNNEEIGPYWPKEREYVDRGYETIPFPFERLPTPRFFIEKRRSLTSFLGYVSTWSAVKEYMEKRGEDPLEPLRRELAPLWGVEEEKNVSMPVFLLMGTLNQPA